MLQLYAIICKKNKSTAEADISVLDHPNGFIYSVGIIDVYTDGLLKTKLIRNNEHLNKG